MAKNNSTLIIAVLLILAVIGVVVYVVKKNKDKYDINNGCPAQCDLNKCNYYKQCMSQYNNKDQCLNMYCGYS